MRDVIRQLPGSKIREVANAGLGRSDVLAACVRRCGYNPWVLRLSGP